MFFTLPKNSNFSNTFLLLSANPFNLDQSKIVLFGKDLILNHTIMTFDTPEERAFWKNWEKGENAGNHHFLLFPDVLYPKKVKINVLNIFGLLFSVVFYLDKSKIFSFGVGRVTYYIL